DDKPEESLRALDEAIARWKAPGFHLQHLSCLLGAAEARLVLGEPQVARAALLDAARPMARSHVLRNQFLAVPVRDLEARVAVACARDGADPLLDEALRGAAWLERRPGAWARWSASLIRGLVAHRRGLDAGPLLEQAEAGAAAADMRLHAAVIRRR